VDLLRCLHSWDGFDDTIRRLLEYVNLVAASLFEMMSNLFLLAPRRFFILWWLRWGLEDCSRYVIDFRRFLSASKMIIVLIDTLDWSTSRNALEGHGYQYIYVRFHPVCSLLVFEAFLHTSASPIHCTKLNDANAAHLRTLGATIGISVGQAIFSSVSVS